MKKFLLILSVLILLSGCTITRVDNYNYEKIMDKILSLDINTYNKVGKGYKYYAPRGVVRIDSEDYNDVLKRGDNKYYLYVDVVSYYYKSKIDYEVNNNSYFFRKISNNGKEGYITIEKKKDKLYVQMKYNYAKIETYVKESDLNLAIMDISYILSSTNFNDSLLKKMYESGNFDSKEEVYKLFDNKEKEGNFLEYIKEFDKYDGGTDETKEEEIIIEEKKEETTTSSTNVKTTDSTKNDKTSEA